MREPIVVINPFCVPASIVDGFVDRWEAQAAQLREAPGSEGTMLYRSVDLDTAFPLVNMATWKDEASWRAAAQGFGQPPRHPADARREGVTAFPGCTGSPHTGEDAAEHLHAPVDPLTW